MQALLEEEAQHGLLVEAQLERLRVRLADHGQGQRVGLQRRLVLPEACVAVSERVVARDARLAVFQQLLEGAQAQVAVSRFLAFDQRQDEHRVERDGPSDRHCQPVRAEVRLELDAHLVERAQAGLEQEAPERPEAAGRPCDLLAEAAHGADACAERPAGLGPERHGRQPC